MSQCGNVSFVSFVYYKTLIYKTPISSKPEEATGRISVKNGGPSRKGEKRANPKTKDSTNRYAGARQIEYSNVRANRKAENVELSKEGLYTCGVIM